MTMVKTPVEIDQEALALAAEVLGTKTKKDTVNAARGWTAPGPAARAGTPARDGRPWRLRRVHREQGRLPPMSPALYLADTSGLFRLLQAKTGEAWDEQLAAGVIATCPVVELEFLYSARSLADRLEKQRLFQRLFTWVPMPDDAYERASEIQQRLTETGHHRSAGPVDLLISVTAERHRLTVLTDDRDFLTVAAVTGQPVRLVTGTN
jgi:predicted nucleic acid-binding protein